MVSLLTVLITWPLPHPPAFGAHLKIHVHLRAESEVPTKRGPACSGSQISPGEFPGAATTRAGDAVFSISWVARARRLSQKRRGKKIKFDTERDEAHKNKS